MAIRTSHPSGSRHHGAKAAAAPGSIEPQKIIGTPRCPVDDAANRPVAHCVQPDVRFIVRAHRPQTSFAISRHSAPVAQSQRGIEAAAQSDPVDRPTPMWAHRSNAQSSCKQFRWVERRLIAQDKERGTRQFMSQRFHRKDTVALRSFSLVEATGLRAGVQRMNRRFIESPCEILVAVFSIALAFFLIVARFARIYTSAVRGVVAGRGEALNVAGLQKNRQAQHESDAGNRANVVVAFSLLGLFDNRFFQDIDVLLYSTDQTQRTFEA